MTVNIEVLNIKEVQDFLKGKNKDVIKAAEQAIAQASLWVEGEVKASVAGEKAEPQSVDTGRFLNSIASSSQGLVGEVSSDVEYGKYLEYGTFKLPERRHFRNTIDRSKDKVNEFILEKIKQATS